MMSEQEEFEFRLRLESEQAGPSLGKRALQQVGNLAAGAVRGAGSIGATILAPIDYATDYIKGDRGKNLSSLVTGVELPSRNSERRQAMDAALSSMGADTKSLAYGGGKMGGEIAGTLGVGGAAANVLGRLPGVAAAAPNMLTALRTGGMSAGTGGNVLAQLGTRTVGGGAVGGTSAALVDPDSARTGAMFGAALPGATKVAGLVGQGAGAAIRAAGRSVAGTVSPEVTQLAKRAGELGIDVPVDRLVNSKPMDAIASGLNYLPFSGRAATEKKLGEQLNSAAARLMGQDTPNINLAIRRAGQQLGGEFERTLQRTGVQFDQQLLGDVARVFNTAEKELGSDAIKAISSQVDDLVAKGGSGVIDGQAAYNIKRTLDRIGNRNGPESFHAIELKRVLMDALNRSLGPAEAQAFATTRQQYGNMLSLEKLAKNGAEGELSIARLANMKNINNEPLQELADIAAQFVKARESQHGAMQRAVVGGTAALTGGLPGLAAGAAIGRGTNMALNSSTIRNSMLGIQGSPNALQSLLDNQDVAQFGYRAAPVLASGR